MKTTEEMEHECNRMPVTLGYLKMRDHAKAMEAEVTRLKRWIADNPEAQSELVKDIADERDAAKAKLSERKTVHQWLNSKGTPQEENGKPLCLLRRLAIALDIHGESLNESNASDVPCADARPLDRD